ncbi:SDR family NAD(P)-dependent oxidoreductase [Pendulispora brunnea]|uniref:SDR family NAD(P)-dependent oxidoreductase n=1 Tax=Pendulispora brunnea TaxID=2905690 RepID=A0ABZ2KII3_9BACT
MEEFLSLTLDNPVVRDHQVLDQHLLPGLAYIDLLYAVFRKYGHDFRSLELRNVSIYHPLAIAKDQTLLLHIRCTEHRADRWRIEIEGKLQSEASKRYLSAEMHQLDSPDFDESIDVGAIGHGECQAFSLDEMYAEYRKQELVHGPFMQARGRLVRTDEAIHIECALSEAARESAEHVMFHPALIDGSAVCGGLAMLAWLEPRRDGQLALPLVYESFRARELLQEHCVARIRRSSIREVQELRQCTLEFFDAAGRKVAELKNVTSKAIRDPGLIDGRRAQPAVADARPTVETFLRELLASRLRRPVQQIDRTARFYELGLQSSELLELAHAIEEKAGTSLSPTLFFEYVTIADLAAHLADLGHFSAAIETPKAALGTYVFRGEDPYLQDHLVLGEPALMGVTHPCLAVESYRERARNSGPVELRNIRFRGGPITLKKGESVTISVGFHPADRGSSFKVEYASATEGTKICCEGDFIGEATTAAGTVDVPSLLANARRLSQTDIDQIYRRTRDFTIGPLLRTAEAVWVVNESVQVIQVSVDHASAPSYALDPVALCSCYFYYSNDAAASRISVPLAIEKLVVHRPTPPRFYIVFRTRIHRADYVSFDAQLVSESGEVVASVVNASIKEVTHLGALVNASFDKEVVSRYGAAEEAVSDIAIIGLVGRYPQAKDIDQLWANLQAGRDAITEIPEARWDHRAYFDPEKGKPGKSYSKWGGFLEDVDQFDPLFFNISPRNAESLDPQIRLYLETVWELLESTGYGRQVLQTQFQGNVGLYVGSMSQQYRGFGLDISRESLAALSSSGDIANRVSNFFDLKGPSIAVDSMCSSSAMAIHMACSDLQRGECQMAIAGGVNLLIHPQRYVGLSQAQMVGSHPGNRSFAAGDGYLPAEGVGAVLLKPLHAAVRDGDSVWAVIKATCTNHSGRSSGYAVPDPNTQAALIERTLRKAGIDPRTISYVESAATGFTLADAVELTALKKAFAKFTSDADFCAMGSVKSHIGHAEAASGISQLTKLVLQMKHRTLIPALPVETVNPNLRFGGSPFHLLREVRSWKAETPRRALINSFGAGGSYVSLVVEEAHATRTPAQRAATGPQTIVLSAMDGEQLPLVAQRLLDYATSARDVALGDIAYTLLRREQLPARLAFVAASLDELRTRLSTYLESPSREELARSWMAGLEIPAEPPHDPGARIVALPTYPFQRRRYWMDPEPQKHPLLHREVSAREFASTFRGSEWFLEDHDRLFPAVAYLEMAKAAGEAAEGQKIAGIRNALWVSPKVIANGDAEMRIALSDEHNGCGYTVTSGQATHAQGLLVFEGSPDRPARPPALDIEALQLRCASRVDERTRNEVMGMPASYDKSWIESLAHSDQEALAKLQAPGEPEAGSGAFFLHPNLGNSALMAAIFLSLIQDGQRQWRFPYTLEAFWIYADIPRTAYVYARRSPGGASGGIGKYDIDVVDAGGECVVAFRGFTAVPGVYGAKEKEPSAEIAPEQSLRDRALHELTRMASGVIKLEASRLDPRAELARYGFDSMALTEFTNRLNKRYALELMPTVFFECSTFGALVDYLVKRHEPQLRAVHAKAEPNRRETVPKAVTPMARAERRIEAVASGNEPIAVVGMVGRFPGSPSVDDLWENIVANRDLIGEVPADRWDWQKYYGDPKSGPDKTLVKTGGFMADVDCFDPLFFGISPLEAQGMDPQLRLFIECAWACIEDAGYRPGSLSGSKTGVFIGVSTLDYKDLVHGLHGQGVTQGLFHFLVANRVSYLLDLHGPSEPIDTACSSSLVAIHRAAGCLRSGEIDAAVVGGVNVLASPDVTIGASQMGMLSEDGRCKTFDRGADGYGRGEGVAALFLKTLSRARADGDRIYGLVRGSAENHGGKATSPTAPNPLAQQELIVTAYTNAGIDVRTMGYIEAHGTGTVLGDPVELNGLKGAFAQLQAAQGITGAIEPHCGVGSLKTNIGHLEAAAGIAGVVKVLMMLRHGRIPGNPHLREPNPYLQLEGTPFYLVRETCAWPEMRDAQGRPVPRRAGVSSFGVGGANAHVVLEQYLEPERAHSHAPTASHPALIVLSAKNEDRLQAQAQQLLKAVSNEDFADADLTDLAYTLQVGREAMEQRLAFTAVTLEELRTKLTGYLEGPESDSVYRGEAKRNHGALAVIDLDEDMAQALGAWVEKGKHDKLLELWSQGLSFDWSRLYANAPTPRRIRLPTYPFARERYWIETAGRSRVSFTEKAIHPLVQRNTSSLREQRFSSTLRADAFFLSDHVVRGSHVLPGVCYLEMARAAVSASLDEGQVPLVLQDIVWVQPLAVADACEVHIALGGHDAGGIDFEIYTQREGEEVVHAQGRAVVREPEGAQLDLSALQSQCGPSLDIARAYEALSAIGIAYGPAHRGLTSLQAGTDADGRRFVMAQVKLPPSASAETYHLHPSVMDSALQASLGLWPLDETARPALPFGLERLDVHDRTPAEATVVVRPREASAGGLQKLDIDLCDASGRVCVHFAGFTLRGFESAPKETPRLGAVLTVQPAGIPAAQYLKQLLASTLKLEPSRIETDAPLERYGIDSVLALKLVNQLETVFGSLPKTLMFEYQSIDALAQYFIENHRDTLMPLLAVRTSAPAIPASKLAVASKRRRGRTTGAVPVRAVHAMEIAIIGVSGRYPQAYDLAAYWENLRDGKDCIVEIPPERWDHSVYFDPEKGKLGKSYSKWGGFIDGVDEFDPLFFNISPKEAQLMDPQERLFLQCVVQTLEDAGYTREALRRHRASGLDGNVGVFVGVMYEEYPLYGVQAQALGQPIALQGSPASIANRVSYFCNFHGPSMAVDTMCSSSLTAIHLACESLQHGGCELAIAGGVNASIHPNKYLHLAQGQFASSMGRCESFGQGGDGYVPGEGVGAVLLKPLHQAIADGDHVYAVIKGTSINHGGKTNGYTVPNPVAQAQVIARALQASGVEPRAVSYIEAHGTGTSLGDPIEIAGLAQAFGRFTKDTQFCAIGSAKSNIGHLESAAGIAGVTKVLLQMRHRMLVPSLHAEVLNPHIDFERTPFKVQQHLEPWQRPVVGTREYPRIAGISSFGAGGANAHVILEEYDAGEDPATRPVTPEHPALIVLSAKTDARLREQARQLLAHVERHPDHRLSNIAYTLQTGREAMEQRLAFTASNLDSLREKLIGYLDGALEKGRIEECFRGEVKTNKDALFGLSADEDIASLIRTWLEKGKYGKLLELWVKGLAFDWSQLYPDGTPRGIPLPAYPFARDRYWAEIPAIGRGMLTERVLHPLVHRNISSFDLQRFSSTFDGSESFLRDHRVQGSKVLPGVCYLEMARAAAAASLECDADTAWTLRNVVWMRPVVVDAACEVHIRLRMSEEGAIEFEVYSEGDVVHAQGQVVLEPRDNEVATARWVDLSAFRSRADRTLDVAQCYETFRAMGLDYGPAHRGLSALQAGTDADGRRFVLAQVALPSGVREMPEAQHCVLHPSVLDSALQALIGFSLADDAATGPRPALPFALHKLECLDRSPSPAWVLIRPSGAAWDIDVCDESGRVCVHLGGLAAREVSADAAGTLLLTRAWEAKPLATDIEKANYGEHWICLDPAYANLAPQLEARWPSIRWSIVPAEAAPEDRVAAAGEHVLAKVQGLLRERPKNPVLFQVLLSAKGEFLQALGGLLKTARQENPKLVGQVITLPEAADLDVVSSILDENRHDAAQGDTEIRYIAGAREVPHFRELQEPSGPIAGDVPWKDGGVYLITGGAGGLGRIMAREIARRVEDATIVLTGRSPLGDEKLAALRALGSAHIEYCALDVSDAHAVHECVRDIVRRHGSLDGIVHSAGVLRDAFLIQKSEEAFHEVLAPKVRGALHLDQATRDVALDFYILFSSVAGVFGNLGQSDYAMANAFLDRFAEKRVGQGRTLSIDWPLWAEGGMSADEATKDSMRERGYEVLSTEAGIEALYRAWRSRASQVVVLSGERRKLTALLGVKPAKAAKRPVVGHEPVVADQANQGEQGELLEKVQATLIEIVSRQLKMKLEDVDPEKQLGDLGFESVSLTAFGKSVDKVYGLETSPAIFFEYSTVRSFAEYLVAEHAAQLQAKHAIARPSVPSQARLPRSKVAPSVREHRSAPAQPANEPIAIIGVSGCFPGAPDLESFWDNLRDGKDSITEVPSSRWDWRAIYGAPSEEGNKTLIKWGGFIEGVEEFDPLFFNIAPREARSMDPQQRLLLTFAWKAIEDAGYSAQSLSGSKTGIFVGTASSGYAEMGVQSSASTEGYHSTSAIASIGPNRVSYLLNIHGPSEPVETACSSSLVAIHRAVRAMRAGECEMALAGGVNTMVTPWAHIILGKAGMLCEDGRCKTFSKDANGYVRGEGVGMLVLKNLSAAERDGDHIYALIRGSSENHGGRASSLTAPNPKAQADVIKSAMLEAGIDPRTVTYVETHGSGTPLGDPIEINGLKSAFTELSDGAAAQEGICGLGSVKTNVGHLEFAAGVAGVIKVLLQLRHRTLVKSLHCEEINPYIQLQGSPFYIVNATQPWPAKSDGEGRPLPRRAGVSSFGFGGVNAHVVLEEYVARAPAKSPRTITSEQPALLVLSARTKAQLLEQARQLAAHLAQRIEHRDGDLADIAYTLQVGREPLEHRWACSAVTIEEAHATLIRYVHGHTGDEELPELLQRWVQGASIDWPALYAESRPRRVSLPTYPFARDRYWLNDAKPQSPPQPPPSPTESDALSAVLDALLANEMDLHDAAEKAKQLLMEGVQ